MKNAAVYIRVSTEGQTEHSPESQLIELKKYAKQHDMIIDSAHIFTDAGISGRKASKRPEFQRMITIAKQKPSPFEVILVWKFSRFARNQEESILYKSLLQKECKVDVISITEETSDSVFGSLIERIIEWMDEFYSLRLSQEVKTKMTMIAEKGELNTRAPFGYQRIPGQPLQINPDEAQWVKRIFYEFLDGKNARQITDILNNNGVRTKQGDTFRTQAVSYILSNPAYCGYSHWNPEKKRLGYVDLETSIVRKGNFEPIISEEVFNEVQEKVQFKKSIRKKCERDPEFNKHWLSGIPTCHSCGSKLYYTSLDYFQCTEYIKGRCKRSHAVKGARIEEGLISALSMLNIDDTFVKEHFVPKSNDDEYSRIIAKLRKQLERAKFAYLEEIDTFEEYSANKARIQSEIDYYESEIKKQDNAPDTNKVRDQYKNILQLIRSDASATDKHDAIMTIVDKIVVIRENRKEWGLDIYFKC